MGQGKNSTRSHAPKSGDGTQQVRREQDANWFGQSQEPQEEFIQDSGEAQKKNSRPASPAEERGSGSSEGTPTFSGKRKSPSDTDNRH